MKRYSKAAAILS